MTVKEASKTVEGYLPNCDTKKFVLDILARAEPRKPIERTMKNEHFNEEITIEKFYICPNEHAFLVEVQKGHEYCRRCGQALDWSGVK